MKSFCRKVLFAGLATLVILFTHMASADLTNRYVVKDNPGALAPYDAWTNAAADIQTAINYAFSNETVLVSNGVYDTGGITNYPAGAILTNRIAIYKAVTVRSANNDPTNTIIKGAWDPLTTNGSAAVRCVYMTNGSSLIGFMLTNGATLAAGGGINDTNGGGILCKDPTSPIISNCIIAGNSAYYRGGGTFFGTFLNCTLIGNSASNGGGAYYATLSNCTLVGNSARVYGGGMYQGTLNNGSLISNSSAYNGGGVYNGILSNCMLMGNSATNYGGGAQHANSILNNCTLIGNSAMEGGGAREGTLNNCTLIGNSTIGANNGGGANACTMNNCSLISNTAGYKGGGAMSSTLKNCLLIRNSAGSGGGGGANGSTLYNCTVSSNSASGGGGGVYASTLNNCIIYFNSGGNYDSSCSFTNCCTTPLPGVGSGNITNDPAFLDKNTGNYRLNIDSACINAGTNQSWMNGAIDLDDHRRLDFFSGIVDIGCYEYIPSGVMGRIR
jgi:hypothetical protein